MLRLPDSNNFAILQEEAFTLLCPATVGLEIRILLFTHFNRRQITWLKHRDLPNLNTQAYWHCTQDVPILLGSGQVLIPSGSLYKMRCAPYKKE